MKTLTITHPLNVEIQERDMPVPREGEALLKMRYGGICGTDLSIYRGSFAYVSYPRIPGHEIAAEIIDVGNNDHGLVPGMLVTANPYFNCGACYSCQRGLVNCCMSNETLGAQRDGAYSEYITLPVERIYQGKSLTAETLALIEPLCISFHGVKRGNIKQGEKVLVIGSGTVGILAAISAKYFGAEVYVCDVSQERLKHATDAGADGVILNTASFKETVDTITHGHGFDVVLEAVGLPSTFQDSVDSAAFGGRVVLIGISKKTLDFDFNIIQKKELNVFGSRNALPDDFLQLIDLVEQGVMNLNGVISAKYPLDDAEKAFKALDKNSGNILKVLLEFA